MAGKKTTPFTTHSSTLFELFIKPIAVARFRNQIGQHLNIAALEKLLVLIVAS